MLKLLLISVTVALCSANPTYCAAPDPDYSCLLRAYPNQLERIEGNALVWRDGTRMALDHGKRAVDHEEWLNQACLRDQLLQCYDAGGVCTAPAVNHDPGRARYEPFFLKMYGATKAEVAKKLTTVVWLPGIINARLQVSTVNDVHKRLDSVSRELAKLPASFHKYLRKPGGTFNWRPIAGTKRMSMHSFGVTLDINVAESHYWRNDRSDRNGRYVYKNRIPMEIVRIFEKYGFIWGGRWYHYDTMHFEYRPELLDPACRCRS